MKFNGSVYQSLVMISQFGINMIVPVLACSFVGMWLDRKLGTSFLVILLFFAGAAAGARNVYRFARRVLGQHSSEQAYLHKSRKHPDQEMKKTGEFK